jgi:hypothetical protein
VRRLLALGSALLLPFPLIATADPGDDCRKEATLARRVDCERLEAAEATHRQLREASLQVPVFFARGLKVIGEFRETNSANTGFDKDGLPVAFRSAESLRRVSLGWKGKRVLEDLVVAVSGPRRLQSLKQERPFEREGSHGWTFTGERITPYALLIEGFTVDAYVSYGRALEFNDTTTDLDDQSNQTTWSVGVTYEVPIDKLFGLNY